MNIKYRLVFTFSLILVVILVVSSVLSYLLTRKAVEQSAIEGMKNSLAEASHRAMGLHNRTKDMILLSLEYPNFIRYFSLADTRKGNQYAEKEGKMVLQFSEEQRKLKDDLDLWIQKMQHRFPIVETCVIDKTGQEHTRLTLGVVAPDDDFSSAENEAPFFDPSFALAKGEVHIAYPYMSPDASQWVFAYTAPIILEDGSKPAFYHYEIPITYFQESIDAFPHSEHGKLANAEAEKLVFKRTFILDPKGFLIADSGNQNIATNLKAGQDPESEQKPEDYFPPTKSVSESPDFAKIIGLMQAGETGVGEFEDNGMRYTIVFRPLSLFGWSIAEVKSQDALMAGSEESLAQMRGMSALIALVSLGIAIIFIYMVAGRLSRPIVNLAADVRRLASGDLTFKVNESLLPAGELKALGHSINAMAASLTGIARDLALQSETVEACANSLNSIRSEVQQGAGEITEKAGDVGQANRLLADHVGHIMGLMIGVQQGMAEVETASNRLFDNMENIVKGAECGQEGASTVAAASEEMTANIAGVDQSLKGVREAILAVTGATEEMVDSLEAIQHLCREATKMANIAFTHTSASKEVMEHLELSAQEIGQVVELINNIAEQTNMLALNASIEAAGAGDAGKGFAVVANEVKELARQTSLATDTVSRRISDIRDQTKEVAAASEQVYRIVKVIHQTNEEISMAVDEQNRSIQSISRAVGDVSRSTDMVVRNTEELSFAASEIARSAADAQTESIQILDAARESSDAVGKVTSAAKDARQGADLTLAAAQESESSARSVLDLAKVMVRLARETVGAATAFGHVTDITLYSATALNKVRAAFTIPTEGMFDARELKELFLGWINLLEKAIVLEGAASAESNLDSVLSGKIDSFQRWLDGDGQRIFAGHPDFIELGEVFTVVRERSRELVQVAREAARLRAEVEAGDNAAGEDLAGQAEAVLTKAREVLEFFHVDRQRLFMVLDRLFRGDVSS
ncbi:MAG: methyl-accepting chemotaxis protein [Magnetococcales bacterium]|nr:methyl-accepting chemotaxis protein [Magnetococcales bacterium]